MGYGKKNNSIVKIDYKDIQDKIGVLSGLQNEHTTQLADIANFYVDITKPPKQSGISPAVAGTTDISVTVQACVDYVNSNGGGYVYIPFHMLGFTLSNRVNWKSNVGLISNGSLLTIPSKSAGFQAFYLIDCINVNFIGKIRMKSANDKTRVIGRTGSGSNVYGIYIGGNSQEIYIDYVYGENLEVVVNMQGNDGSTSRNVFIKEIAFRDSYQPFFVNHYANLNIQYIRGLIQNIAMDPLDHVIYINDSCTDLVFGTIQATNLNADNGVWAIQINPHTSTDICRRITFNTIHLDGSWSGFVGVFCESVSIGELTGNFTGATSKIIGSYGGSKIDIEKIIVEGTYQTLIACIGDSVNTNELSIRGGKVNASGPSSGGYIVRGEYTKQIMIGNVEFNNITFGGTSFYFPTNCNSMIFSHCRFNFQTAFATIPFNITTGNAEFKDCKFINNQTLYDQVITVTTGANAKVINCTMTNFKTYLHWNMTGTGQVYDSVLTDDNSIINGTFNKEVKRLYGSGSPEGVITAKVGSTYFRNDGGAATTYYVKETGTGNTGWAGK